MSPKCHHVLVIGWTSAGVLASNPGFKLTTLWLRVQCLRNKAIFMNRHESNEALVS